jgi:hypothetical protein
MSFSLDDIDLDEEQGTANDGPHVLFDPTTGAEIPIDDIDAMVDAYERVKNMSDTLYKAQLAFRYALGSETEGDTKTRRLRGKRRCVAVTLPGIKYTGSLLKQAWADYGTDPEDVKIRDELLRVDAIGVKAREWKKARGTKGTDRFEALKAIIARAEELSDSPPVVKIEA